MRQYGKIFRKLCGRVILGIFVAAAVLPAAVLFIGSFLSEDIVQEICGSLSGMQQSGTMEREFFSADQYRSILLASPDYLFRFWNSVKLVLPVVVGQLAVASFTAYGLSQGQGRLYAGLLFLCLILMMTPYQVSVIPNYYAIKELKLLETDFSIWLPGIFSPFSIYLLTKYMKRIPREIIEAAELDGAGSFQIFRKIMLPLCRGQIAALGILVFADYWNQVELPLVMYSDAFQYPLSVFLSKIREDAVGISLAASVIYTVPVFLIFLYGADELKAGIADSGVK